MTCVLSDKFTNSGIMPVFTSDEKIYIIDQSLLPNEEKYISIQSLDQMVQAISTLKVRGAPAIGIAGSYAMYLAACEFKEKTINNLEQYLNVAKIKLDKVRPTAVNLSFASKIMLDYAKSLIKADNSLEQILAKLLQKAKQFHEHTVNKNKILSLHGEKLIKSGYKIMTHCNAGPLATGGWGTALGVIRASHFNNKNIIVFVNETRPLNQGSRITAYELAKDRISAYLSIDSASSLLIKQNKINMIIVGADRIAANGDTANKVGSCNLAIIAKYYNIPFYVAAPFSTIDLSIDQGGQIPIEYRNKNEIIYVNKTKVAYDKANIINPSFDIVPNDLISAIITEHGILYPPYNQSIKSTYNANIKDCQYEN